MISCAIVQPDYPSKTDRKVSIDARVVTKRHGAGRLDHALTLEAQQDGSRLWTKTITFGVDAPFDVPDLTTLDPFLIASLFPAMGLGGTLRIHGPVSRQLLRNVIDYQSAWSLAAPEHCRLFELEAAEIADVSDQGGGRTIVALSGGVDSLLALFRNASGDAGPTGHDIRATMMIHGMATGREDNADPTPLIDDLRSLSANFDLPMAIVDTNITEVVGMHYISHATWLASCLGLFSEIFDVGLIGSSVPFYDPGWEVYGSHPLLDPFLSSGKMAFRDDEGLYGRVDKVGLLSNYPAALEKLRVCLHPFRAGRNCCRCEKCIRTMLSFIASGNEIPESAFPQGLRPQDIGIGLGQKIALELVPGMLAAAERNGTGDRPEIQALREAYRHKRRKVIAKDWLKRLGGKQKPPHWQVLEKVPPG
ncbi:MAG: hypothetical protein AAF414_16790 [Pseudomonadota bacterium]